jgi:hypothetical protein
MKRIVFCIALIAIIAQGCDGSSDPIEEPLTTVTGRILDARTFTPLSGLLVVRDGARDSTTTSSTGSFTFGGVRSEVRSITISGIGISDTTILLDNNVIGHDFGEILLHSRARSIAEYPLDESRTTAGNSPGHVTLTYVEYDVDRFGRQNGAIDLSYDGAQVTIDDANAFNFGSDKDFSISLWVKMPPISISQKEGHMPIVSKGEGWPYQPSYQGFHLGMFQSTSNYYLSFGIGTNKSSFIIESEAISTPILWHHYVVTVDRVKKMMTVYVDGVLDGRRDHPGLDGHMSNTSPLVIGGKIDPIPPNNFPQFRGQIDDLRFYDGLLDSADVKRLYHEKGY